MCLTYGRPKILEEAIKSFLRQDYRGQKELIVLNDLPEQTLQFDHPEVNIINVAKRFRTVGEKRNACAALCSHEWLLPWDDDDIFLPWRLSYSMEMMDPGRRFFKSSLAFVFSNGTIKKILNSIFHAGSCWHRSLFDEVQGYPHMGSGQDIALERKFEDALSDHRLGLDNVPPEKMYYVYRWAGTGSYHLSALAQTRKGNECEQAMVADYIAKQLSSGEVATGEVVLNPGWKTDYVDMVGQYLRRMTEVNSA